MASTAIDRMLSLPRQAVVRRRFTTRSSATLVDTRLWLVLATVLGAVVRLYDLGAKSLWNDEIISINIASWPLGDILRARLHLGASDDLIDRLYTNNPPFHLIVLHAVNVVSSTDFAYRLPFALAGIVSIPVAFHVVRRLLPARVAYSAALLMAVSPLHIAYAQEARPTAFLVLFSLISLGAMLDYTSRGTRSSWLTLVIFSVLNVWTSYFALILVVPTLGCIALVRLYNAWRISGFCGIRSSALTTLLAFAVIGLCALPLVPDILATSDMNNAGVSGGFDIKDPFISLILVMLMALPISSNVPISFLTMMLVLGGLVALAGRRDENAVIVIIWTTLPLMFLSVIQSDHILELRYALFIMPFAFAAMATALHNIIDRLSTELPKARLDHLLPVALAGLIGLSLLGLATPARDASAGQPIKVDWKSVVAEYQESATANSCLIVLDGTGHAMFGIVQHYLGASSDTFCAVDVRDPRLLEVIADRSDLWWAIGTQWYTPDIVDALRNEFTDDATINEHFLTMVIHPEVSPRDIDAHAAAESFLRRAIAVAEPPGYAEDNIWPVFREGLLNLLVVRCGEALPAETVTALLANYASLLELNNDLAWGRAQGRLDRGDIQGARAIGVRLVGLAPGDPEVYDFLADVERADNRQWADGFAAAARALRLEAISPPESNFVGC